METSQRDPIQRQRDGLERMCTEGIRDLRFGLQWIGQWSGRGLW